jgi:hypothetical protein
MSDYPPLIFDDNFPERHNVAYRVERGKIDPNNPLLAGEYPWDATTPFYNGTVLKDPLDGRFKLWGITHPHFDNHKWGEWDGRMGYAESDDGVNWTRPMLDGFPCMGYDKSNVLFDFSDGGNCFQMSVMVDPEAPPEMRYEMFVLRKVQHKNPSGRIRDLDNGKEHPWGLYRYHCDDGIHWKPTEGPIDIASADSLFVYRDLGAPYVAYHKMGPPAPPGSAYAPHDCGCGTIRIVCRRESEDGSHWSDPPLPVVTPDWRDSHDDQCMDLGPIKWGSGYFATVTIFHALNQTMDIQFAASRDGKQWFRPIPRVPCVPLGMLGDSGGGHLFQSHSLVEDDDQIHVYYFAGEGLHSDLYKAVNQQYVSGGQESAWPHGGLGRASWDRGRFYALVPATGGVGKGYVTTYPVGQTDKTLHINAVTYDDGEITAELVVDGGWEVGDPVPGYTRDDCVAFCGDNKCTKLVWKEHDQCPDGGLLLRIHLYKARLYGFEWR